MLNKAMTGAAGAALMSALIASACGGSDFSSGGDAGSGGSLAVGGSTSASGGSASGAAGSGAVGSGAVGGAAGGMPGTGGAAGGVGGGGTGGTSVGGTSMGGASMGGASMGGSGTGGAGSGGGQGGSGGMPMSCTPAAPNEVWVNASAQPGGTGSADCPLRTIQAGVAAISTGVVNVQAGPTYQGGGLLIPSGIAVKGTDPATKIDGAGPCIAGSCVVRLEKNARLENVTLFPGDAGADGVQAAHGGQPILRHVRVRGGRFGIVLMGSARLETGVQSTDSAMGGLQVLGGANATVTFNRGSYVFSGSTGFGVNVTMDAVIDMRPLDAVNSVQISGNNVGMRFAARDATPGSEQASVIKYVQFDNVDVNLEVFKKVGVRIRSSEFAGVAKPIRLHAPSYADFGTSTDNGKNVFSRDVTDVRPVMMVCDQTSSSPDIQALGNTFPSCPVPPTTVNQAQGGGCPATATGADLVALYGSTQPFNSPFVASCQ